MSDALTQDQSTRQTESPSETAPENEDYISIGGVKLRLDEIINEEFLAPKKIRELGETFSNNSPFPHWSLKTCSLRSFWS
ncbi:hypothetical protein [Methylocapsa palsarum]|uniref:Uncharacterized protein n=1 Tax=Methylocapsa palsarum TaxID=1612308 RepID=A0A1I4CCW6_9HYPH|nr:hypothetical protein [Methylocapsa palsarum]SFK78450.1 hypothetical protein SAMN05444581_12030 [Methylocapsa palsarum]